MPTNSFLGVFAKSPLKPLELHIDQVDQCSQLLDGLFDEAFKGDWAQVEASVNAIAKQEKQADVIKRELRTNLPGGIFMPVSRQQILELLTQQDLIANRTHKLAMRISERKMAMPASLQTAFMAYLQRCLDATGQARKVINELDDLLETGFKGREVKLVEEMIHQFDAIEDDIGQQQSQLRLQVLALESSLSPVDVMFLYNVIEWVSELAEIAERVGAQLEIMLAS